MNDTVDPAQRAAAVPARAHSGPVTLVNSFVVEPDRDAAFIAVWSEISAYFRAQPGFVGLRLHRAMPSDARYRYVNVADWASAEQFRAAHGTAAFRELMSHPGLPEFPSNPVLYEVVTEYAAPSADAVA